MPAASPRHLLEILTENGPTDVTDLATHFDTHPLTIANRCADLQTTGYLHQPCCNTYAITDAGIDYLEELTEG